MPQPRSPSGAPPEAIAAGVEPGYALDDGAGLLFEGTGAVEAFSSRRYARVLRVETDAGEVREVELRPQPLAPEIPGREDPAIEELRALRRSRAGGVPVPLR